MIWCGGGRDVGGAVVARWPSEQCGVVAGVGWRVDWEENGGEVEERAGDCSWGLGR